MENSSQARAVTELLEGIDVASFSTTGLLQRVEALRGRPVLVFPVTIADPHLHGAWVATLDYDCICLDKDTAPVHQNHILCHELGHMILGHSTLQLPLCIADYVQTHSAEAMRGALEHALSQPEVLKRDGHDSDTEQAAEAFATALQNELIRRIGLKTLTRQMTTSSVWSELAVGLGLAE